MPRGYALMLALVLTAGVLGASSLLLSRVKEFRERSRREVHVALVASALRSAERAVVERQQAAAREPGPPPVDASPWSLTVGHVKVDVAPSVRGAAVVHGLHAQWGGIHRRSDVCTTREAPGTADTSVPSGCVRVAVPAPAPPPASPDAPAPHDAPPAAAPSR